MSTTTVAVLPLDTTATTIAVLPDDNYNQYAHYNHESLPSAQVNIINGSSNNNSNNNNDNNNQNIPVATAVPIGNNMYGWISPRGWNNNQNILPLNNNHIHPYDEAVTDRQIFLIRYYRYHYYLLLVQLLLFNY